MRMCVCSAVQNMQNIHTYSLLLLVLLAAATAAAPIYHASAVRRRYTGI